MWPVVPERRSNRIKNGGAVLEMAQALKAKNNLPPKEGKKTHIIDKVTSSILDKVASTVGLKVGSDKVSRDGIIESIRIVEENRNQSFNSGCSNCKIVEVPVEDNRVINRGKDKLESERVDKSRFNTDQDGWSVVKNRKNKKSRK